MTKAPATTAAKKAAKKAPRKATPSTLVVLPGEDRLDPAELNEVREASSRSTGTGSPPRSGRPRPSSRA